ncbi:MAG: alpha-2-macroglobulin [Bryobacterales bacterium]|nr:alpha-2-macroglobulin [Bryobacterales bacterium]
MTAWLLVALLVLPLPSQEDTEPYFGLNSNQTYAEGESPSVGLWANGVNELTFRVYRVDDPLVFFANLDEPHRFGGRAPRPPAPRTFLESFHRWKIRTRNSIRDLIRAQYTVEDRHAIRAWMQGGPAPGGAPATTQFAQLPVLNSRQLVATWSQPVTARERWDSITVPIPVQEKGLYLVEATSKELAAYTVVIITDLALTTKLAEGNLLGFLVNRKTGAPVADAGLHLIAGQQTLASWKSDASGMVSASLSAAMEATGEVLLVAASGKDVAATTLGAWAIRRGERDSYKAYIYTDRPVYRPGDTVRFKGIVRQSSADGYAVPSQRTARVTVNDGRGQPIYEQDQVISAWGTFHGELTLGADVPLGYFAVEIDVGEYPQSGGFHVEEYKKPEYEVKVRPRDAFILQGRQATVEVDARYYFGEPVTNATLEWVAYSSRHYQWFDAEPEDRYSPDGDEGYDGYFGAEVAQGTATLDAEGKALVTIPLRLNAQGWDERMTIQAKVRDAANREINGSARFVATFGDYHVEIRKSKWVYEPGEEVEFTVRTRRYDGQPVAANVTVTLERREWQKGQQLRRTPVRSTQVQTGAAGTGTGRLAISESGSMGLVAVSADANGRRIRAEEYLWVAGDRGWSWSESRRIEIIPDKSRYEIGDTAEVLIVAGAPGIPVLVTVEAGKVYQQTIIPATDGTVRYRFPILEEYAPNVFVLASFMKDNQHFEGSRRVMVPAKRQKLDMTIRAAKTQFQPGEKTTIEVEARDWQGKPAANAELSLGVVDEAIYAVRQEALPEVNAFFHGVRYHEVFSFNSLDYYFSGEAGKRRMQLALRKQRKTLAELKGERYVDPKVRKYFPDTALWLADVKTDASGKAKAEITFPDALTTWRTTVRAVTRETQLGSAVDRRIVRKNLILRLAVPRFFTVGDEVEIPAIVMNYLESPQRIQTSLSVEGLELLTPGTQELEIPPRGEATARFRVRATKPGEVKITGRALGTQESDAIELALPVRPFGIEMISGNTGSMTGSEEAREFQMEFPADAIADTRSLELKISPSIAGSIFNALEYLTSFPYGCTEQTMSSFLPNIIVSKALDELKIPSNVKRSDLVQKVREGIDRLSSHQHPDGGWGWWATDESHPFMTAYVLYGLEEARKAGYQVPGYKLQIARNWLRSRLLEDQRLTADLRGYIGYALLNNGQPDQPVQDMLYAQLGSLSSHGASMAGLGMHAAGDPRTAEFVAKVERGATDGGSVVSWRSERDDVMGISYNSTAEVTAFAMKLLLAVKPDSPLIAGAAQFLVANRSRGQFWDSTKTTAMVVFGLTDYLKQSGELKPSLEVEVFVDGQSALKTRFGTGDALKVDVPTLTRDARSLGVQGARVRVVAKGEGRVYWSAVAKYFGRAEGREREGSVGLNLLREYFSLQRVARDGRTVYRLGPMPDTLRPGDLVAVRLTVTGNDWRYLMIEDPIPSGTEFIDRRESYELENRPAWWGWNGSAKEYRDDRAALFQYEFSSGQRQFTHILRVVNSGTFNVSPAQVQPMYQPGYQATTAGMRLEVRP